MDILERGYSSPARETLERSRVERPRRYATGRHSTMLGGTGLSLYIVREIMIAHGGQVTVRLAIIESGIP
jgi:signal transduction histidine kinase